MSRQDWLGDAYFRCLGYVFQLRWDSQLAGEQVLRVLDRFEVSHDRVERRTPPTPNVPAVYSLTRRTGDFVLLYGNDVLFGPEAFDEALCHLLWHINVEMARVTGSYLLVHAGVVASPAREAMIFPGDSGSGKTTLVAGLARKGFAYLSDEAAAIDPVSRRVYAFPKALTLKRGSFALFPDLAAEDLEDVVHLEEQWLVSPSALDAEVAPGPCPARWIVSIRYQSDAVTRLERITAGAAVLELGRRLMNMPHYEGRALPVLADVARGASSYRLTTGDLGKAVAALEHLALRRDCPDERPDSLSDRA